MKRIIRNRINKPTKNIGTPKKGKNIGALKKGTFKTDREPFKKGLLKRIGTPYKRLLKQIGTLQKRPLKRKGTLQKRHL